LIGWVNCCGQTAMTIISMDKPGKVKLLKPLKLGADKSDSQQE